MLKTNSKEVREAIKNLIWDNAKDFIEEDRKWWIEDGEDFANVNENDFSEVCNLINCIFYAEKLEHDNRFEAGRIDRYTLFREWVSGLSRAIPHEHYLKDAVEILGDILQETEAEKARFTQSDAEALFDRLMYDTINRHATKTGIK